MYLYGSNILGERLAQQHIQTYVLPLFPMVKVGATSLHVKTSNSIHTYLVPYGYIFAVCSLQDPSRPFL